MKTIDIKIFRFLALALLFCMASCKNEELSSEPAIVNSFTVLGKDNTVFTGVVNEDNTITIKVSPYLDPAEMLESAVPTFYLAKGATVSPDPDLPQNFAQQGGVKYTVLAQDGSTKREYTVSWGVSDQMADGEGFSFAEVKTAKNFAELGFPGEFNNFGFEDSKLYGDLDMYHAYCGEYIVLLSRAYIDADADSKNGVKVVNRSTLQPAGEFNLGGIAQKDLKIISSDYTGKLVGAVVKDGQSEFFYWTSPSAAPVSMGSLAINVSAATDGASNFQVAGDIANSAWITALAARDDKGSHYRLKVSQGKIEPSITTVTTGYSSSDAAGFQMISPLDDSDRPAFLVGDTKGSEGTANSIGVYVNSFAGSTTRVMPALWQNMLQTWWVGTGVSTARYGGRSPVVSGMVINGKSYAVITSGTAWWHAAAVMQTDLQTLAHQNLNIATSVNRGWSYGSWVDWCYDEEAKEGHLAIWFSREGLRTYKLTCFE